MSGAQKVSLNLLDLAVESFAFHLPLKLAEFKDERPNSGTCGSCGLDRERFYRCHGKVDVLRM